MVPYNIVDEVNVLRRDGGLMTLEAIEVLATAQAYRECQPRLSVLVGSAHGPYGAGYPGVVPSPWERRSVVAALLGHYNTNDAWRRSGLPKTTFFRLARQVRAMEEDRSTALASQVSA